MEEQKLIETPSPVPPPPAYKPAAAAPPPKYSMDTPLPTYTQSEKFEKEGLLPAAPTPTRECEAVETRQIRRFSSDSGSCFEFVLFFIVCAVFGVVGFLISFCLASTTAAQSGAVAGLGTAFVAKPLLYEFYYKGFEQEWTKNWCSQYDNDAQVQKCVEWCVASMRTVFFIIGFIGLILLFKGFSAFFRSRGSSSNN